MEKTEIIKMNWDEIVNRHRRLFEILEAFEEFKDDLQIIKDDMEQELLLIKNKWNALHPIVIEVISENESMQIEEEVFDLSVMDAALYSGYAETSLLSQLKYIRHKKDSRGLIRFSKQSIDDWKHAGAYAQNKKKNT